MKVILYASMSVNGFIARDNDEEDFLSHENWFSFQKLAKKAGCFVVGRRAYEVVKKKYTSGYNFGTVKAKAIVLSRKKSAEYETAGSPRDAAEKAKSMGFRSLIVSGGSKTNASFMRSGLVSEIILNVEPFVLGRGFSVFDELEIEKKMSLKKISKLRGGIIQLRYAVRK